MRSHAGRFLRVAWAQRGYATAPRIRNLGIIAHIDAGKTTTTERMLYYAGYTQRLGNVDSGDTITDFLTAERERGITIQSAAITFGWNNHQINLIDTPGHADFNFEVVRSLRVLDGAITILDGVAGVEALTEKVWATAQDLRIPRVVYINKMDRAGAGFGRTAREVVSKLKTRAVLLNLPYFEQDRFVGIIDVLNGQRITYKSEDGKQVDVVACDETPQKDEVEKARQALIEQLSEVDEEVVSEFVETDTVSSATLTQALKRATIANRIVPILCGASFRNMGIQPLLDAAVQYLPEPKLEFPQDLVRMLAFKVRQDPQRGTLVFVRVYSGVLRKNSVVFNTATGTKERVSRLLRMQADEPVEIDEVKEGDIAVLSGTTNVRTGDTLIAHASKRDGISSLKKSDKETALLPIPVPPPVFVSRITPKGPGDVRGMKAALEILLREDPSLHLGYDQETGQYLLSGMGELHLEIACGRLVDELKARVDVGEIMITFKETIQSASPTITKTAKDEKGGTTEVKVSIQPRQSVPVNMHDNNAINLSFAKHPAISRAAVHEQGVIGLTPVLALGGQLGRFALFDLNFDVQVRISPETDSIKLVAPLVREAASEALAGLTPDNFALLEPVMDVQLSLPQSHIGTVMTDLSTTRRGTIVGLGDSSDESTNTEYMDLAASLWTPVDHTMYMSKHGDQEGPRAQLKALVPLRKMVGYLSSLRSMTQGRGTFEMSFSKFENVPQQDIEEVLEL